jgi:hypothetical protein
VSWLDLDALARHDPGAALRLWGEVVDAARGEVSSGHRAARALEGAGTDCWDRARFLAVRSELSDAWGPRDADEQHLIDLMAQHQALIWRWQQVAEVYAIVANLSSRGKDKCKWPEAPRLTTAEALDRAVSLVERYQRLYLQALHALQGLRRRTPQGGHRAGRVNF